MLLARQQHQRRGQARTSSDTRTSGSGSHVNVWWCCCTVLAVLKWLEIVFAVVIIAVLAPILCISPGQYDFVMFAAAFCLAVTALTLIIYFFRLHTGPLKAIPWRKMEIAFNALAILLYLTATCIGIYHCVKLFQHKAYPKMMENHRCSRTFPKMNRRFNEDWRGRVATVTVSAH